MSCSSEISGACGFGPLHLTKSFDTLKGGISVAKLGVILLIYSRPGLHYYSTLYSILPQFASFAIF